MPEFLVTVRYTISWTAEIEVRAKDDEGAEEKAKKLFGSVADYKDFEQKVLKAYGEVKIDTEEFEVNEVIGIE